MGVFLVYGFICHEIFYLNKYCEGITILYHVTYFYVIHLRHVLSTKYVRHKFLDFLIFSNDFPHYIITYTLLHFTSALFSLAVLHIFNCFFVTFCMRLQWNLNPFLSQALSWLLFKEFELCAHIMGCVLLNFEKTTLFARQTKINDN